jgi:hypothetical protein
MQLEKGELFVIVQGVQLADLSFPIDWGDGELRTQADRKPQHDRSDEGKVFRVLEACGEVVAGKVEWQNGRYSDDRPRSIHTHEVEIWPVTEAYLSALKAGCESP